MQVPSPSSHLLKFATRLLLLRKVLHSTLIRLPRLRVDAKEIIRGGNVLHIDLLGMGMSRSFPILSLLACKACQAAFPSY